MKRMSNFDLLDFMSDQYSDEEYTKALIDYCYQDLMSQKLYEEEYGKNCFTKLTYPLNSEPIKQYPTWEVNIMKEYIK